MTLKFSQFNDSVDDSIRGEIIQEQMMYGHICLECFEDYLNEGKETIKSAKALNALALLKANIKLEKQHRDKLHGKIADVYGEHKPEPRSSVFSHEDVANNSHRVVSHFLELEKTNPKAAKQMLADAKERRIRAGFLKSHLSGNDKNETANDVEYKGKKNDVKGMTGSAAFFKYRHKDENGNNSEKNVITCAHSTSACAGVGEYRGHGGCEGGSCLAMSGHGAMAKLRARRAHYEQGAIDPRTRDDHALTLFHELREHRRKAHKNGRNAVVRLNNYSEHNMARYGEMIKKFVNRPEVDKKGKKVGKIVHYNYTKNPNDKNEPKNGVHYIFSDIGPSVHTEHHDNGSVTHAWNKESKKREADRKKATTESDSNPHPMNQYSVVNLRRPSQEDKLTNSETNKKWNHFQKNIKNWRHWEHTPAKEEEGDDKSGNRVHHEDGHGYQYFKHHDGTMKKYTYQDHTVIKDKNGNLPSHDARFDENEVGQGKTKNREGKKLGGVIVSSAVNSTSDDLKKSSAMFHNHNNLDNEGTFHVNHPNHQISANQIKESLEENEITPRVRISQRSKTKIVKNRVSGHKWPEETLLNTWDVRGPYGKVSTHKSYEAAEKSAKEHQDFYDKFFPIKKK